MDILLAFTHFPSAIASPLSRNIVNNSSNDLTMQKDICVDISVRKNILSDSTHRPATLRFRKIRSSGRQPLNQLAIIWNLIITQHKRKFCAANCGWRIEVIKQLKALCRPCLNFALSVRRYGERGLGNFRSHFRTYRAVCGGRWRNLNRIRVVQTHEWITRIGRKLIFKRRCEPKFSTESSLYSKIFFIANNDKQVD